MMHSKTSDDTPTITSRSPVGHTVRSARVAVATLAALALTGVPPSLAQRDLRTAFSMLDIDADGALSRVELRGTHLVTRLTVLDADGNGSLSPAELGLPSSAGFTVAP